MTVELRREVLARYGITLTDVQLAIVRQSLDLPAGALQTRDGDLIVRFTDARVTPAGFAELVVVGSSRGARIRLGDIAGVGAGFERPERSSIRRHVLQRGMPGYRGRCPGIRSEAGILPDDKNGEVDPACLMLGRPATSLH